MPYVTFYNNFFLRRGIVNTSPNPHVVSCQRRLIQYTRSCPPYLEDVSYTRNRRTLHAVVTGIDVTWENHELFALLMVHCDIHAHTDIIIP
jgi:hypothetical protein